MFETNFNNIGKLPFTIEAVVEMRKLMKKFTAKNKRMITDMEKAAFIGEKECQTKQKMK